MQKNITENSKRFSTTNFYKAGHSVLTGITWLLYGMINLIMVLRHEPWRDEAQAWLISKDLSVLGIFQQMKYEGHPCLWHLLLAPFSKSSLPLITINFISLFIMCAAAFLFLRYAPFSYPVKALCLFSSCFMYYYPVIARSYCLIPLILFLTATAYKNRSRHPIRYGICLAFITQTHVIMLGLYGMLSIFFAAEEITAIMKKRALTKISHIIFSFFIILSGFLLLCVQIMGSIAANSTVSLHKENLTLPVIAEKLRDTLSSVLDACTGGFILNGTGGYTASRFTVILIIVSVFMIAWLIYSCKAAVIFLFSVLYQLLIYTFVATHSVQRSLTLPFLLLFCLWISNDIRASSLFRSALKYICIILFVLLCISSYPDLMNQLKADIQYPYSNTADAAVYIKENLPSDSLIICTAEPQPTALIATLPTPMIWNCVREKYQTFTTWDEHLFDTVTFEEMKARALKNADNPEHIYVLFSLESSCMIPDLGSYVNTELEQLAVWNDALVYDEKFILYKLKQP